MYSYIFKIFVGFYQSAIMKIISDLCCLHSRRTEVFITRLCPDRRGPVKSPHSLPPCGWAIPGPDYSLSRVALSGNSLTLAPTGPALACPGPAPGPCKPVHPSLSRYSPGHLKTRTARAPAAGGYWKYCLGQVKIRSLAWAGWTGWVRACFEQ